MTPATLLILPFNPASSDHIQGNSLQQENGNNQQNKHLSEDLESLNHVMIARLEKVNRIRELGWDPFPTQYHRDATVAAIFESWEKFVAESPLRRFRVAGRLSSLRLMGKAAFADLADETARIQIYVKKDLIGDALWELFLLLDIGDIIGITGTPFVTKSGERSLQVGELSLLTKSLRPLPAVKEKDGQVWYGWDDKEERYRQRTIDLILNRDSREVLLFRSRLVSELRSFFAEKGDVEVETPVLQAIYGGAAARPFTTYHKALNRQLYLRIATELYLKRIIAGGISRVFEIGKDFRNEGIDRMHSPEFTMLEAYTAFENYEFCMKLCEELLPRLALRLMGKTAIEWDEHLIELAAPYRRLPILEAILQYGEFDIQNKSRDELASFALQSGIPVKPEMGKGKIIDEIFSAIVQPKLIQPTFITDLPVEVSPLAKRHPQNPDLVERFELYIGAMEVVNAFSELNDPVDQRCRFEEQARLRAAGDEEAAPIDEEFLQALEIGMPPTAGLGMGVDRLTMLMTNSRSIRDVIFFPLLRTIS